MNSIIKAVMLIAAMIASTEPIEPQKWQNPAVWGNIKTGQTPQQVSRTLGEPKDIESTKAIDVWYYGDVPQADENGKMIRPKHGFLMFRRTPTGTVLQKWAEPDWLSMPTWEQLQADYEQALADLKAAEIAERKRIAEEAAAVRAEQAEERKHIVAEATALRQQQRQAQVTTRRERTQTTKRAAIPAAKPDAHTQLSSRYFIMIGISFFVIAFIIAGSYGFKMFRS